MTAETSSASRAGTTFDAPAGEPVVVMRRTFDAPRALVWKACTEPEQVARWWGPRRYENTVLEMDVRPGGRWRIEQRGPDGRVHRFKGVYHEVVMPERLVNTFIYEDDAGTFEDHPFSRRTPSRSATAGRRSPPSRPSAPSPTATGWLRRGWRRVRGKASSGWRSCWRRSRDRDEGAECQVPSARCWIPTNGWETREMTSATVGNQAASAEESTADREIVFTRLLDAPRERVFDAFTDPAQVGHWFGPTGFTLTIHEMDVRPGGVWRFIMHGPDGVDWPNHVLYHEVVRPERLVYDHGDGENSDRDFHVTITFADEGGRTRLTMRSLFPTAAARDYVVREVGAIEGGNQTLDRLTAYLAQR